MSDDETKVSILECGLDSKTAMILHDAGITYQDNLAEASLLDISELKGIGPAAVTKIALMKEQLQDVQQTDRKARIDPQGGGAVGDTAYNLQEPPEDKRTVDFREFTVRLKFRHADWVEAQAELTNTTAEHVIEQCIRQSVARDPYKAGKTVGASTVLKHDNPHANAGG